MLWLTFGHFVNNKNRCSGNDSGFSPMYQMEVSFFGSVRYEDRKLMGAPLLIPGKCKSRPNFRQGHFRGEGAYRVTYL
jgi:hypothetical protein